MVLCRRGVDRFDWCPKAKRLELDVENRRRLVSVDIFKWNNKVGREDG
jgi:hypothetical protein